MAQREFKVRFEFVSVKAEGDLQIRHMTVRADTAQAAENTAWMQRGSYWGAFGTDNALDCKVVD